MTTTDRRRGLSVSLALLLLLLTACSLPNVGVRQTPTRTPTPLYTIHRGGACVSLGNNPHPPYTNVRVSNDTYRAHSEPMLAENPENPLNLVGGSKFFTDPAHYHFIIGTYASFDGGCTWSDGGVLPGFASGQETSDVTIAFGVDHNVYVAVLYVGPQKTSGIAVSTSTDGGKTFGPPVKVYDDTAGRFFSDKPWLTVDRTNGPHRGALYVVWSYDAEQLCRDACTGDLAFARSTDGGKTFSQVRLIEGQAPFCTNPGDNRPKGSTKCDGALGATPVVEPDGTLVVAFDYTDLTSTNKIPTRLLAVSSRDGGATWSDPVLAATVHDVPFQFTPEKYRNFALLAFAGDPQTGQLYLAWEDQRNGDPDILLMTSRNTGKTWSAPVRVNDDSLRDRPYHAYQFQPQLAVAPDGVVSVSFFDTRNDPTHRLIDVYLAQSLDHGATFLTNLRVTTQAWDPRLDAPVDTGGAQFIGDYQGLAADDHFVHPFWNDTRTGSQEIFTAAIPSARPRTP